MDRLDKTFCFSVNCVTLDESFVNQSGNHIKVILKDYQSDPKNNQIIFIESYGRIVGYVALKKQYKNIWDVAYIFVDKNHQKRPGYEHCNNAKDFLSHKDTKCLLIL